jgi:hypothetical protein
VAFAAKCRGDAFPDGFLVLDHGDAANGHPVQCSARPRRCGCLCSATIDLRKATLPPFARRRDGFYWSRHILEEIRECGIQRRRGWW